MQATVWGKIAANQFEKSVPGEIGFRSFRPGILDLAHASLGAVRNHSESDLCTVLARVAILCSTPFFKTLLSFTDRQTNAC